MNRRNLLRNTFLGVTAFMSTKGLAQNILKATSSEKLELQVVISRNHGHELAIVNTNDFVKLLRKIENEGSVDLSIQGQGRHPHLIEIDSQSAMDVLLGKEVQILSTQDAGHRHNVTLKLI